MADFEKLKRAFNVQQGDRLETFFSILEILEIRSSYQLAELEDPELLTSLRETINENFSEHALTLMTPDRSKFLFAVQLSIKAVINFCKKEIASAPTTSNTRSEENRSAVVTTNSEFQNLTNFDQNDPSFRKLMTNARSILVSMAMRYTDIPTFKTPSELLQEFKVTAEQEPDGSIYGMLLCPQCGKTTIRAKKILKSDGTLKQWQLVTFKKHLIGDARKLLDLLGANETNVQDESQQLASQQQEGQQQEGQQQEGQQQDGQLVQLNTDLEPSHTHQQAVSSIQSSAPSQNSSSAITYISSVLPPANIPDIPKSVNKRKQPQRAAKTEKHQRLE